MLKEIHEQPRAMTDTLRGRISLERRGQCTSKSCTSTRPPRPHRSHLHLRLRHQPGTPASSPSASSSSCARVPVEVDLASEFRYRDPLVTPGSLVIAISQSRRDGRHPRRPQGPPPAARASSRSAT
jgi:glucosamine--fructose-6-phosphate aminotransferase (isomerizing)